MRIRAAAALFLAGALLAALASCASPVVDTTAVDERADRVAERIVDVCAGSGMFRRASVIASIAVPAAALPLSVVASVIASIALPAAALPLSVVEAGVDIVCRNPARFAHDAATVGWVARNLHFRAD